MQIVYKRQILSFNSQGENNVLTGGRYKAIAPLFGKCISDKGENWLNFVNWLA